MSKALITEGYLTDIANAIRAKNGSSSTYTPPQMAAAIAAIPTGSDVDVEPLSVTQNGTYTAPSGKAYSPVTVNVSGGSVILHGQSDPTEVVGNNGNIYLKTTPLQIVEYIENDSAGNAYINTKFKPTGRTKVEMVVSDSESIATWFGMWNNSYNSGAFAFSNDRTGIYVGYAGNGGTSGSLVDSSKHTITLDKGTASVDSTIVRTYTQSDIFSADYPLFLFTQNRKGNPSTGYTTNRKFRLYSCKIYNNDVLVMDLVPVIANEQTALLDKVGGGIYYNAGGGSFVAGGQESESESDVIVDIYLKVEGAWQQMIGSNIENVGGLT